MALILQINYFKASQLPSGKKTIEMIWPTTTIDATLSGSWLNRSAIM
jgi:hypothetical protein